MSYLVDQAPVNRLRGLFNKYKCDKGRMHRYERFYANLPAPKRVLEVGIFRGESLRAWREFWPDAHIVAIDTFQRIPPEEIPWLDGVEWYRHDSRDPFGPSGFDLIIDDGDHRPMSQAATFENLIGNVAPGGRYVIEDVWPWDRMSDQEKRGRWANEIGVSEEGWTRLMDVLRGRNHRFHDFRSGGCPDSFLIEVLC